MSNEPKCPLGFEDRRKQDELLLALHKENKKRLDSWISTNALAIVSLVGALIWGILKISTVSGQFEQSLIDMNQRISRIESKVYHLQYNGTEEDK